MISIHATRGGARKRPLAAGFFAALLIAGCGDTLTPTSPDDGTDTATNARPVASIVISPDSASLSVGQTRQFTAVPKDVTGGLLVSRLVTWRSSDTTVVKVSRTGLATAIGNGSTTITATRSGVTGEANITVSGTGTTQPAPVATVTLAPSTLTLGAGATQALTVTLKDASGAVLSGRGVTFSSSNGSVASVNASGVVTGLLAGTATVSATSEGKSGSAAVTVTSSTPPPTENGEPVYTSGRGTLLWQDAFEAGSDAALLGNYSVLNGQYIHAASGAGLNGSGAARIDWVAGTSCQDDSRVLEKFIPATRDIVVSYTVRYTAGFTYDWRNRGPCTGNAKKLFFLYAVSGSRFDFISENHVLGMGSDYDHPLFSQNTGGSPISVEQLGDGRWHRITIRVRQSSTPTAKDGAIYGWIDGVQKWSVTGIASNASGGWNYFRLPATFNQGSPVAQSEWLDDLVAWVP
jgi:uncharacterized protein YjdB